MFCLCCIFFPTSAHQGQRAQDLITVPYKNWRKALKDLGNHTTLFYHLTSQNIEIPSSRIDNIISSNEVNRIKENHE